MWPDANANHRHDPTLTPLGRYWDDVVGGRPAAPDDLDPTLVETVQRLHARDDAPGADAAFATQLLAQLEDRMDTMYLDMARPSDPAPAGALPDASRRVSAPWLRIPPPQRSLSRPSAWPLAQLASAALVVITLAFAFVALGPPRRGGQVEPSAEAPAAIVTVATATPSAADDTLAAITLPAGALPGDIVAGLNSYSVPVGSEGTWDWACCTGVRLDYIRAGELTITGAGPMQILRAEGAGSWEEVAPGTEIVLRTEDALLSRMEDRFESVNSGSAAVDLLDSVLFAGTPLDDPVPYAESGAEAWQFQYQNLLLDPVPVAEGPVTVRLRQVELAAEEVLPIPANAIVQLAVDLDENAVLATAADFSRQNMSEAPLTVYALTLEAAAEGTPAP